MYTTKKKRMLKVMFYLRNAEKAKKNDLLTIYCQMEIEGMRRDVAFSTKMKVPKQHWHRGTVANDYHNASQINRQLQDISRTLCEIYDAQLVMNSTVSYDTIKNHYDPDSRKPKKEVVKERRFLDVMDDMIAKKIKLKEIGKGTARNYKVRRKNLAEFFKKYYTENIKVSEIRYRHIEKLLETMIGDGPRGHINKHAQAIKSTIDYALHEEIIKQNPIGRLGLRNDAIKPPCYLLPKWRAAIMAVEVGILQKARDVAVFLWNTGLSYVDYLKLRTDHLVTTELGRCFKIDRNKTDNYSLPPLLPDAAAIIEKYGSIEKLPRPNINDLNKTLKYLGLEAGVTKDTVGFELSTSVFRETYASMMENEYMTQERTLMHMMGHTSPKQLNNYSRVMPQRVLHEIRLSGVVLDKAS